MSCCRWSSSCFSVAAMRTEVAIDASIERIRVRRLNPPSSKCGVQGAVFQATQPPQKTQRMIRKSRPTRTLA